MFEQRRRKAERMRNDFATMAILVPSRGRPDNIAALLTACEQTFIESPVFIICDDDDVKLPAYRAVIEERQQKGDYTLLIFQRSSRGMAAPLNKAVQKLLRERNFTHFAFLGDDHRPQTVRWDQAWIDILEGIGGLVYGDDLLQRENLPTAVGMHGRIARELDGMVPPGFIHLYLDNFWKRLGEDIGRLTYLPDCIIEHCHPLVGKAEVDEGYVRVNAADVYELDGQRFNEYMASREYQNLLVRVK
jgi:hypothetical protein